MSSQRLLQRIPFASQRIVSMVSHLRSGLEHAGNVRSRQYIDQVRSLSSHNRRMALGENEISYSFLTAL
jgi:hypothetical protein